MILYSITSIFLVGLALQGAPAEVRILPGCSMYIPNQEGLKKWKGNHLAVIYLGSTFEESTFKIRKSKILTKIIRSNDPQLPDSIQIISEGDGNLLFFVSGIPENVHARNVEDFHTRSSIKPGDPSYQAFGTWDGIPFLISYPQASGYRDVELKIGNHKVPFYKLPPNNGLRVRWAGDIDGDGQLDFYTIETNDNGEEQHKLYLSSHAILGSLIGEAASYSVTGD